MQQITLPANYDMTIPLFTLFRRDMTVDEESQREHIHILHSAGQRKVFVCSTTGENPVLSAQQRDNVAGYVLDEARSLDGLSVAVGLAPIRMGDLRNVSEDQVRRTIEEANSRLEQGAYAVVLTPPFAGEYDMDQAQLRDQYFHPILSQIEGPVILYNFPALFDNTIETYTLEILTTAYHGDIKRYKNSGTLKQTRDAIEMRDRTGLNIGIDHGNELELKLALLLGANGGVASIANVFPELFNGQGDEYDQGKVDTTVEMFYPGQTNVPRSLKTAACLRYGLGKKHAHSDEGIVHPETTSEIIGSDRLIEMDTFLKTT